MTKPTEPTEAVFAQRWMTLMKIVDDHELIRFIKRAHLRLPENLVRASLIDGLEYELQLKDLEIQLAATKRVTAEPETPLKDPR